jgi:hypothetical protein
MVLLLQMGLLYQPVMTEGGMIPQELTASIIRMTRRMASSGMLHLTALVRTDVPEELTASIIRMTRIGELGTTLAVTSNRCTL